jgi:predicted PurR-regulated permease PerM
MERRTLRILILCLIGFAAGVFLYYIRSLLIPFAIAALMAYIIFPLVRSLEVRGVERSKAIFTVYCALIILLGIILFLFVPTIFNEVKDFAEIFPVYAETWENGRDYFNHLLNRISLPMEVRQILMETINNIRKGIIQGMRDFAGVAVGVISLLPSFMLAPFLAYYIVKDFSQIKKAFLGFLPPNYRKDILILVREGDIIFSQFLRGRLLISMIVGFLTGVGAALINVPFAVLIGLFTAIADLIPFFGPILAAIPVIGLALTISHWKGFVMLGIFLFVQQLEASYLTPSLLGDRVGLNPMTTVFVLLVGGYVAGPLGLIFAVPVAGLLRVVLHYLWEKIV